MRTPDIMSDPHLMGYGYSNFGVGPGHSFGDGLPEVDLGGYGYHPDDGLPASAVHLHDDSGVGSPELTLGRGHSFGGGPQDLEPPGHDYLSPGGLGSPDTRLRGQGHSVSAFGSPKLEGHDQGHDYDYGHNIGSSLHSLGFHGHGSVDDGPPVPKAEVESRSDSDVMSPDSDHGLANSDIVSPTSEFGAHGHGFGDGLPAPKPKPLSISQRRSYLGMPYAGFPGSGQVSPRTRFPDMGGMSHEDSDVESPDYELGGAARNEPETFNQPGASESVVGLLEPQSGWDSQRDSRGYDGGADGTDVDSDGAASSPPDELDPSPTHSMDELASSIEELLPRKWGNPHPYNEDRQEQEMILDSDESAGALGMHGHGHYAADPLDRGSGTRASDVSSSSAAEPRTTYFGGGFPRGYGVYNTVIGTGSNEDPATCRRKVPGKGEGAVMWTLRRSLLGMGGHIVQGTSVYTNPFAGQDLDEEDDD